MPCRGAGLPPLDCFSSPAPTHRGAWTSMRKLLLQLDSSKLPSVFDRVVAYDGGADEVMSYGGITPGEVRDLVYGCIFTRGPKDLKNTAVFIGGADMAAGEALLAAAQQAVFKPFTVSLMLDSNGSNTTAVAAVAKMLLGAGGDVRGQRVLIVAGTGPVGVRAAGLFARAGADVVITSRKADAGERARDLVLKRFGGTVRAIAMPDASEAVRACKGAALLLNAGPAGVMLVPKRAWANVPGLKVVADVNAVPPLAEPAAFVALLDAAGPLDLVAGPSGYGLPLTRVQDASDEDLRLAFLTAPGESGGIGGLSALVRALARTPLPVVLTPGVVHLPTVPEYRKVNRVDMGTAEKVCVAALAIDEQARRFARPLADVSLVLLELGGAFTAAVAVAGGRIVDGVGGSSGPLGFRAAGALDGEVAYLAGAVPKQLLFGGGAAALAGWDADAASPERLGRPTTTQEQVAWDAFVEGAAKAAIALAEELPAPKEFVLSGRLARVEPVREAIRRRLSGYAPTRLLDGFAQVAKQGAQGAALVADGLAGGAHRELVETLGIREARGTVLDHLYVVRRNAARRRLGLS